MGGVIFATNKANMGDLEEIQERRLDNMATEGGSETEGVHSPRRRTVRDLITAECEGAGWSIDVLQIYL